VPVLAGGRHVGGDRVVAVAGCVRHLDVTVHTATRSAAGLTLQDEHDLVVVEVNDEQSFVQAARRGRAVLPPPVGAGSDHVGGVDDENSHLRYLPKSCGRSRAAAAFS
jgi:hypothetical protein